MPRGANSDATGADLVGAAKGAPPPVMSGAPGGQGGFLAGLGEAACEHGECVICLEPRPLTLAVLTDRSARRVCRHFLCLPCARALNVRACPVCRAEFVRPVELPSPHRDPRKLFQLLDSSGDGRLGADEVCDYCVAFVGADDPSTVRERIDALWSMWDVDGDGSVDYLEFVSGVCPMLEQMYDRVRRADRRRRQAEDTPSVFDEPERCAPERVCGLPARGLARRPRAARGGWLARRGSRALRRAARLARRWFNAFDEDRSGHLDRGELMRALLKTVPGLEQEELASVLAAVWPLVDHDGSGHVDREEFMAPGGLLELLRANLRPGSMPTHGRSGSARAGPPPPTPPPAVRPTAPRAPLGPRLRRALAPWARRLALDRDQALAFGAGACVALLLLLTRNGIPDG